ncbi:MAG TPA: FhaA domain-containing protein [Anaerolineales bacterium]
MPTLDELESRLQSLLEVHFLKYLPGYKIEDRIYHQLANAMHNSLRKQGGKIYAPNVYVIISHPSNLARWNLEPRLFKDLAVTLQAAGEEAGFHFLTNPTVSTAGEMGMVAEAMHIIASYRSETVAETHGMPVEFQADGPIDTIPPNAFLILNGTKIIPLNFPVINIGRRLNNQVIIDDQRVSRTHAQLRVTKGRFTLFDLNSTGGTLVNGQRISKAILYPGDVISLAGVTLIFGQDLPTGRGTGKVTTAQKATTSDEPSSTVMLKPRNINKEKAKKK